MLYLYFLLYLCSTVYAKTDEELKVEMVKIIMTCHKDHPVEMSELFSLEKLVVPKKKETKCLLACAYRKEGSLNSKGMYDVEHANQVAEVMGNGDENQLKNAKKLAEICSKVNDEPVTDGEKGCDRAALIFKCITQNAPKFGFKV